MKKEVAKRSTIVDAWRETRDGLRNLVSGLGTSIDKSYSTQYHFYPMNDAQLIAAYRSDWIVRKAVDIPALDAVREWRAWQASDQEIRDLTKTEDRLMLRQRIRDCLIRARLFGGAVLIMGIDKADPESELDPETVKKDSLKFIHVMARSEVSAGELDLDPLSEFYGEPTYYEIRSDKKGSIKIHPSRVVRLIGNPTPLVTLSSAWGDPILQSIDDAVKQAGTASQALVALIQEAKTDIVKIPGLMDNISTAEYEQKLLDRFSLAGTARSIVNTYILDSEEEWQRSQTNFSSLPDAVRLYLQIVSGAADIPATRMLGQSPSGAIATGDHDLRNYYDKVSSEQENVLRPALQRLDECIIRSALGDRPEEIYYEWAPLWQMDEGEKAKMVLAKAQALQIHHDTGLLDPHALSEGFINQLIADNVYPGLSLSIEDNQDAPALQENMAQQALLEQIKSGKIPDPNAGNPNGGTAGKGGVVPPSNPPSQNPKMVAKQKAVAGDGGDNGLVNLVVNVDANRSQGGRLVRQPDGSVVYTPMHDVEKCNGDPNCTNPECQKKAKKRKKPDEDLKDDDSRADPFFDLNECHNPAGQPDGGQFCSDPSSLPPPADPFAEFKAALEKQEEMYHGTSSAAWKAIKKEGLVPGAGKGADFLWQKNIKETNARFAGRDNSVFLASNEKLARQFAEYAAQATKSKPLVLRVKVPYSKTKPDEIGLATSMRRIEGKIPPAQISLVDANQGEFLYVIVPIVSGTLDYNECHNPPGPRGGQFCNEPGTPEGEAPGVDPHEADVAGQQALQDLNLDHSNLAVDVGEPPTFEVDGVTYKYGGAANLETGQVTLYSQGIYPSFLKGLVAHEAMHVKFEKVLSDYYKEFDKVMEVAKERPSIMNPDGTLKGLYADQFPKYQAMTKLYSNVSDKIHKEDGVSHYSKAWWNDWKAGKTETKAAMHETMAEMYRLKRTFNKTYGGPNLRKLFKYVREYE